MLRKIFDAKDKIEYNKKKRYLTVIMEKNDRNTFIKALDNVVKVYDYDIVRSETQITMALVMTNDKYHNLLAYLSMQGYALFAYPTTKILYALVKIRT